MQSGLGWEEERKLSARVTVRKGWVIQPEAAFFRLFIISTKVTGTYKGVAGVVLEEANFEMTFSDRITCVRIVTGLPKTSS